jgi:dienelactone hydrolase
MKVIVIAFAAVILSSTSARGAEVTEEQLRVPVKVAGALGKEVAQDIVVTVFHDDTAPRPYPLIVLNHGRSWDVAARAALGRAKYSAASRWFAGLGFMVAVPTRVGYGVTGGEDVEDSGPCNRKTYEPAYAASMTQTLAVIGVLRARGDVARDRTVVVGQSFGGTTAIAVAAQNTPGVQAAINFAGGGGGNPTTRPQQPCGAHLLERLFAGYGKTARIPTLWVYSENDMYFGPRLPRQWFSAYRAAGGPGEFSMFPAVGDDGHALFTRAPQSWQPRVLEFLRANGYPGL